MERKRRKREERESWDLGIWSDGVWNVSWCKSMVLPSLVGCSVIWLVMSTLDLGDGSVCGVPGRKCFCGLVGDINVRHRLEKKTEKDWRKNPGGSQISTKKWSPQEMEIEWDIMTWADCRGLRGKSGEYTNVFWKITIQLLWSIEQQCRLASQPFTFKHKHCFLHLTSAKIRCWALEIEIRKENTRNQIPLPRD